MTPRDIIVQLLDMLEKQAMHHLPGYVQESWLQALSEVVESGVMEAWEKILTEVQVIHLETGEVVIRDNRNG